MSSPLVEFHVSSLWGLKPYGVREIISQLKGSKYEKAEFLFDQRRNWFQITCQTQDVPKIKRQIKTGLEELQEDVLDEDENLVDNEGALVKRMDNALIGLWDHEARLEAMSFTEFRLPDAFDALPHRHVWDSLNHFRLSDLLTYGRFQELQKLHNVILGRNLALTEVYIGAESEDELDRVRSKLDVLLKIKELKYSEPTHLIWTEAYTEKAGFEMTFDTRFLANIDPALIAATFLDVAVSADSTSDYEMLPETITLRICRYDEDRGYHTSLIGPKLKARRGAAVKGGKRRYTVRNHLDGRQNLYGADIDPKNSIWISPERGTAAESQDSPYGGNEVEKWLNQLEEAYAGGMSIKTPDSTARAPPDADQDLIAFDEPAVPATPGAVGGKEIGRSPAQTRNLLDPDDVFTTPMTFTMRPLMPQPGSLSTIAVPKTKDTERSLADLHINAGSGRERNASRNSAATHASRATSKASARPERAAAQIPDWFVFEINQTVHDLVSTGPYLRGKLSLRADLGRILITGMDYTGLAFNPPGTRSNGWKRNHILRILNHGSRIATGHGVTFTRMLTQDGDDIEYMLSTRDIATGKQLWKTQPTERVVYSFYCVSKGHSFFMDLEADEKAPKFNYSLRTKQDDKAPIWIHCTLRSWDARIIMSHADTEALEAKYGEFAKSFVNSFSVTLTKDNTPHIQIGVHKGFGVSVESMRIQTSFRFLSSDEESYLDITEVEETVFKACGPLSVTTDPNGGPANPDRWMFYTIDPKRLPADVRSSQERGIPTFWYEASIRSVAAEKEFAANQTMGLGEKAPWDFGTLAELGVVASIYKTALRMVQTMDSVGAHNDNHQEANLVMPRANMEEVPGANWATKRDSSTSSSASRRRIPMASPAALVQASGPPNVVAPRASSRDYLTPPSTVTSPVLQAARTPAAATAQKRIEGPVTPSNDRNVINSFAPVAAQGGGGFGVHGARAASRNRQPGQPQTSSTGSDASRGHVSGYKPPNQFW
ncbi:hypothetical protein CONLIGDRAFT_676423 [Coniochaeta ligniaria NRRL 30616]|uniref:Uncharacterized protein n=1 Tax=Coniochaeta ligniaria NRRL 30616 TaxID=1408157 RepID=A0A1J7J5V1_9PEZI|nr:hypothetical protein CONLIGDRAFT_676423 [Coniochaeta ligniaria NRRL 30616]